MKFRLSTTLRHAASLVALSLLLASAAGASKGTSKKEQKAAEQQLPQQYQEWLTDVRLLITKEERAVFLAITEDYQRDVFIDRFWELRDRYADTTSNEFKQIWYQRLEQAKLEFGGEGDERYEIFMLNGAPNVVIPIDCSNLFPAQVWYYERVSAGSEIALLFYKRFGGGKYRLWYPSDGFGALSRFEGGPDSGFGGCLEQQERAIGLAIATVRKVGGNLGFGTLVADLSKRPEAPSKEWVATFESYSTELPPESTRFDASLEVDYPGRRQSRTLLQGIVSVDIADVQPTDLGGHESYNFVLTGEVLRDGRLFDRFRYKFNLPKATVTEEKVPLIFERYLRNGNYTMYLKLEDLGSNAFCRIERELKVPKVQMADNAPAPDSETGRILAEANRLILTGDDTVKLVQPFGELHSGLMRFDTLVSGDNIAEVAFSFDDKEVLRKKRPPYSVELDLGSLPRRRVLQAIAYDTAGEEVARDELILNTGSHRFGIRLIEPRPEKTYEQSLRARAEIEVPDGRIIDRVEFYVNETLSATLYQEPWVQPLILPPSEFTAYVRAVAYQPDGNFTEDTVFINGQDFSEEVKVNLVELYITVLDRDNRPVQDLLETDFTVLEDGVTQSALRFDQVSNLPIHAGVLFDVSASIEDSLELAQQAALGFFQQTIQPRDRATLITFNDHPDLSVPFTNDIAQLSGGLAGVKAERGTALYDSIIFSLYYFNGVRGQRAIVLLSDGKDENSRFEFDDSLEFARRAGVAIYSIGLRLPKRELEARRKLRKLADETGGRAFFVQEASELEAIYATIQEELRSRYYITYQSTGRTDEDRFRTIEVKMAPNGLEAKTKSGYYP